MSRLSSASSMMSTRGRAASLRRSTDDTIAPPRRVTTPERGIWPRRASATTSACGRPRGVSRRPEGVSNRPQGVDSRPIRWIVEAGRRAMSIQSVNPATGETLETFEETSPQELERSLAAAAAAFHEWRGVAFATRAQRMREAARVLRARAGDYARTMTLEMGKPVVQAEAEIDKCAVACEYYADHTEAMLAPQPRQTDAARSYVRFDPLGPVLAIMPWNFPFWQVFRFAAPALMAGNAGILKHASNVPRCALEIERVFREAGFPRGLFSTVLVGSAAVPRLIADPRIVAATLTGSDLAGRSVASKAGAMLKKTVLELGGSDPYIVLEDADLELAAAVSARGRLLNAGQSCIAAKRFIVTDKVRPRFEELFVERMRAAQVG